MAITTAELTGVEETSFITLHARALDAQTDSPILGDPFAVGVVDRLDYDWSRLRATPRLDTKERLNVAIRAVQFDQWLRQFTLRHPDAVVLDLGCGLDSRAYRVPTADSVDWYNVDHPYMINLHGQAYPSRSNVHLLAASLETGTWLDEVSPDRPAVMIMDGLYPFMTRATFTQLLNRLVDHFATGEILLLGFSKFSSAMMARVVPAMKTLGVSINEGFDDPHDVEQWEPRLRLSEVSRLIDAPSIAQASPGLRIQCAVMRAIPALARADKGLLRYVFGADTPTT